MIFIETTIFTRRVQELLSDEVYRQLQIALMGQPELGPVIQGTGGLRKVRWSIPGRGKSGGVRIIYYLPARDKILMVFIYSKGEQDDLTPNQLRALKRIIEEEH